MSTVKLGEALEHIDVSQAQEPSPADAAVPEVLPGSPANDALDRDASQHPASETTAPLAPLAVAPGEITIVMTDGSRRTGRVVWSTER